MKCCQTGKQYNVKVKDLSRDDGEPMTSGDLAKGSTLVMDYRGKSYPVQFTRFNG